jgi:OOP family OmpA-OmpF porin
MKWLVPTVLAIAASGCAKPWPQVDPVAVSPLDPGSAEWRVTDHVVVVTDASGTMAQEALLPDARAITRSFVAGMPADDARAKGAGGYEASLIAFGGGERIATEHAAISQKSAQRSVMAARAEALRPLGAPFGGRTPIADVLDETAASLQGKQGRAAVLLVSDGQADDPERALASGRALVAGYGDELCIHTVHVGESAEGRALLERLANLSTDGCGSSREAAAVKTVAEAQELERSVFFGAAPLPPVAARPCDQRRIVLRGIHFALDSAELGPESGPLLDVAVEQLNECPGISLVVEGHTCALGTDAHNHGLSERRAASVREYLVGKGIAADRLTTRGLGEVNPVASNDSEDGRSQNRRVELVPMGGPPAPVGAGQR